MLVYTCVFFLLQQMNLHIFNILLLRDENITVQKNRFYTSGDFKKHSDRLKSDLKPGKSCFLLTCGNVSPRTVFTGLTTARPIRLHSVSHMMQTEDKVSIFIFFP